MSTQPESATASIDRAIQLQTEYIEKLEQALEKARQELADMREHHGEYTELDQFDPFRGTKGKVPPNYGAMTWYEHLRLLRLTVVALRDKRQMSFTESDLTEQLRYIAAKRLRDIRKLQHEVNDQRIALERKNRELDALHYVWCTGGCSSGQHRFPESNKEVPLTLELVNEAIRQVTRLACRWSNTHSGTGQDLAPLPDRIGPYVKSVSTVELVGDEDEIHQTRYGERYAEQELKHHE